MQQRYNECKTRNQIGLFFGISASRVKQIEENALQKIGRTHRAKYIQYGIEGFLNKKATEEYYKGYRAGYKVGYKNGSKNTKSNIDRKETDFFDMPIEALRLSARAYNCLHRAGLVRIRDVALICEERISKLRGLGNKSAAKIAKTIQAHGIYFTVWDKYL